MRKCRGRRLIEDRPAFVWLLPVSVEGAVRKPWKIKCAEKTKAPLHPHPRKSRYIMELVLRFCLHIFKACFYGISPNHCLSKGGNGKKKKRRKTEFFFKMDDAGVQRKSRSNYLSFDLKSVNILKVVHHKKEGEKREKGGLKRKKHGVWCLASDRRLLFVLFHYARFSCNIISLVLLLTVCFYPSNQDQGNVLTWKCHQSASAKHILLQVKVLQEAKKSKVAYIYSTCTSGKS